MLKYDNEEESLITIQGTQYAVKFCQSCKGCIFEDPIYKILISTPPCPETPCTSRHRKDKESVIFVEIPNVPIP